MRNILIITLIFCSLFQASCQSEKGLKLVTEKRGTLPKSIEKYYIDKKAGKVRTGKYEKLKGRNTVQTGFYKNDMKDSLWTDYSLDGQIVAQGYFDKNDKIGIWYYLSFQGDTIQIYNHSDKVMLMYNVTRERELFPRKVFPDGTENEIDTTGKIIVDKMPIFIGGTTMIHNMIMTNLAYPVIDAENGVQGVSNVSFTVDKNGGITNVFTKNSISPAIDKEAVRLVELLGDNWEQGEQNGKTVNVEYTVPLTFKLD